MNEAIKSINKASVSKVTKMTEDPDPIKKNIYL